MSELEQLDMTIEQFCEIHNACEEGRDWAIANCKTMTECWANLPPSYLIWTATRLNVLSEKELRLFAVFCCRAVWHLLIDQHSRNAVEVAERFANGQASKEEMHAAYLAAWAAYASTYTNAADVSAAYAAYATTYIIYSGDTALMVARLAAVRAADWSNEADEAAVRKKQADWLRSNTIPNFKKV